MMRKPTRTLRAWSLPKRSIRRVFGEKCETYRASVRTVVRMRLGRLSK